MSYFENLWEEYRDAQVRERDVTGRQLEEMRAAFFTGAWCHMAFARRLGQLRGDVAVEVIQELEEELSSAIAPREYSRMQFSGS